MARKRLVLLYGKPGNGKSYLSRQLRNEKQFRWVSTDRVYVDWIRDRFPDFFFPRLRQFIAPHWEGIILAGMRGNWIVENMNDAWAEHLIEITEGELDYPKVVVEGYLLQWAHQRIQNALGNSADVLVVEAKGKRYFDSTGKEIQLNDIAGS